MIETVSQMLYRVHSERYAMECRFQRRRFMRLLALVIACIIAIIWLWHK